MNLSSFYRSKERNPLRRIGVLCNWVLSLFANGVKMGTYTTNYNLFMPTVGEQGWGDLVNGNFETIDTTMKGLDGRVTTLEAGEFETINCTGTITAGEFVGSVGNFGNGVFDNIISNYIGLYGNITTTQTNYTYATCPSYNLSVYTSPTEVIIPYNYGYNLPIKISEGVYITEVLGNIPTVFTRTLSIRLNGVVSNDSYPVTFYYKTGNDSTYSTANLDASMNGTKSFEMTVETNSQLTYYFSGHTRYVNTFSLSECPTYYLTLGSPIM